MSDERANIRQDAEQQMDQAHQMGAAIAAARSAGVPPVNVDVPSVQPETAAVGDTLSCTMGNWQYAPTDYTYQWKSGDTDTGDGSNEYIVVAADTGKSITCVVTAINSFGPTTAPPSNAVAIPAAKSAARATKSS